MKTVNLFETNLTSENASASIHGANFVDNETCSLVFYIGEQCVYETPSGRYYCHSMPNSDREFFHYGQLDTLAELEPLDQFYEKQLATIVEENMNLSHYGIRVVEIEVDKKHPDLISFYLYHPELQAFFEMDLNSRAMLTQATIDELCGLGYQPNTLASAYYITVADDGSIDKEVSGK